MMKLSTKGRYGLRAMLEMALHEGETPLATRTISEHQRIPERYLEQLLIPLKQAGLVRSIRGAQGGYLLGRSSHDIKVSEIIRALEGPIAPMECVNELNPENCARADSCATKAMWSEMRDAIVKVLDSYTLGDLAAETKQKRGKIDLSEILEN